jgi:ABC-type sugar transport system substrate-binding protein
VSKRFQHQFWQVVKSGAEQAGKDYKVRVTFEGPETEAMVDKQIDMLAAVLAKKPNALGFAVLDSKAAIPLPKKAQAAKIPVGIGYKTVEAAVKALKGEKLPKIIDTGFYWYDKKNIDDPKIAAVLCD